MKTYNKKFSSVFVIMNALFVSALLISNVLAAKQFEFTSFFRSAGGVVVFPITYILSDVFSEIYGYKVSRWTAWLAFAIQAFASAMFALAALFPYPVWWENQAAFVAILGSTWRVTIASLVAYQCGDWLNDIVFQKLKLRDTTKSKFALRAIASSLVGETIDGLLFVTIAFWGKMPLSAFPSMIIAKTVFKVLYEIVLLPVTTRIIRALRSINEDKQF